MTYDHPCGIWAEFLRFVAVASRPDFIRTVRETCSADATDELIRTCQQVHDLAAVAVAELTDGSADRHRGGTGHAKRRGRGVSGSERTDKRRGPRSPGPTVPPRPAGA